MGNELDLDIIKEFWKQQNNSQKYSQAELLAMLNKKSSNNVKYIVWISIIEVIILVLSLFITTADKDILSSLNGHIKEVYVKNYKISQGLLYINIIVSLGFILYFYRCYKKINILSSVKDLIKSLFVFRRSVNIFIFINITLGFLYLFLTGFYDFIINIKKSLQMKSTHTINIENIHTPFSYSPQYFILFIVIFILILLIIVIYYLLAYGVLMRRLKNNLNELKKYDESEKLNIT